MHRYSFVLLCLFTAGLALTGCVAYAQDDPPGVKMMTITRVDPDPALVPTLEIKTGDSKNAPPVVVYRLTFDPSVVTVSQIKKDTVQIEKKGPSVVQAGNTPADAKVLSVALAPTSPPAPAPPILDITLGNVGNGDGCFKGDGYIRIKIPASVITDPTDPPIRDEVSEEWIRLDGTPPDVEVYETPDTNVSLGDPRDFSTDTLATAQGNVLLPFHAKHLIYYARFIDESAAVTGFDETDVVINGAAYTLNRDINLWWWWDEQHALTAVFPSGARCPQGVPVQADPLLPPNYPSTFLEPDQGVWVYQMPDPKLYAIVIFPRTDGLFSVQVASNKDARDDILDGPFVQGSSWVSRPSNVLSDRPYIDAPRVNIMAVNPTDTNAQTLNFTVEFNKMVWGLESGDIIVDPPTPDFPGVAGGTKTVVVIGSSAPGDCDQRYNVAVSGMTYSGYVRISLSGLDAWEIPYRPVNGVDVMNWSSENTCSNNRVNFDGTPPDSLTITRPVGLPQPPAVSGSYTTSLIKIDIAGTVHDDVGVAGVASTLNLPAPEQRIYAVSWANDRWPRSDPRGYGRCVGTASWTADGVYLKPGRNQITIAAHDAAGNETTYTLVVNCTSAYSADAADRPEVGSGTMGQYSSIALDGSANPRIAYYGHIDTIAPGQSHGTLRYAAWGGQAWHTESVDGNLPGSLADDVGWFTSLKLDGSDNPHISYYDVTNQNLKYATWQSGEWDTSIVAGHLTSTDDAGQYSSMALYNDVAHSRLVRGIAYYDYESDVARPENLEGRKLKYAYSNDGVSWTRVLVDSQGVDGDVGQYASLAVDPTNGNPWIVYYDRIAQRLKYARSTDGGATWTGKTFVDSVDRGRYCSIAIDPRTSNPCISYYDAANMSLMYTAWNGATWLPSTTVDSGVGTDVGQFSSLALFNDVANNRVLPKIAYYDAGGGRNNLKLVEASAGSPLAPTWSAPVILDDGWAENNINTYDVGQYCSLAISPAGNSHISYYDATGVYPLHWNHALDYIVRTAGPTCTVDDLVDPSPTNHSPLTFRIAFSNPVSGLTSGKVDVTLGTAGALTEIAPNNGTTYQLLVVPTGDGTVSVSVPPGAARYHDPASGQDLDNQASNIASVVSDRTRPSVQIDQDSIQYDPTNETVIYYTVVFTKPVTGFTSNGVDLSGSSAEGSKSVQVTGEGTTYHVAVTGMSTKAGAVVARVRANAAVDTAGNGNYDSASTDNTVWWDGIPPTCVVNQAANQSDPSGSSTINFTATFSEPVVTFTSHWDVVIGGTASFFGGDGKTTLNVSIASTDLPDAAGHYRIYNIAVSGMQTRGTVTCTLNFSRNPPAPNQTPVPLGEWFPAYDCAPVTIGAGLINRCLSVSSTDNVVTYDSTAPTCTINQAQGQSDPTNAQSIRFAVEFSKDIVDFGPSAVQLTGTAGNLASATKTVTGSGRAYTVTVEGVAMPAGQTTPCSVIANIAAGGAHDVAGNANQAATFQDNTVMFDDRGPMVTVNQAAGQPDSTLVSPIHFTAVFSEPVNGFTAEDVLPVGIWADPQVISIRKTNTFDPASLTVYQGDTVRWYNERTEIVTLEILDSLSSAIATFDINPGAIKWFAFPDLGTYTYRKSNAPTFLGTLTVDPSPVLAATVTEVPPNNHTTYDIVVSGMATPGTVTAAINAGGVTDDLGNLSEASTSVDNSVVWFPQRCATAPVTITDNSPAGVVSTLNLSNYSGIIADVNVVVNISHAYDQDLTVYLIGPDSTTVELFSHVGSSGANFINTVLDDEASQSITGGPRAPFTGSFKPTALLSAFDAKSIGGIWTLKVVDSQTGVQGSIESWCLQATIQDTQKPDCTITGPGATTNITPINFTISFLEPVFGLTAGDLVVTGGTVASLDGSGAAYVVHVTPTGDGRVELSIPAGSVHDTCGNFNPDSPKASVMYNGSPTVTIRPAAGAGPTAASVINFTVVFNKAVTGFGDIPADVSIGGTAFVGGSAIVGVVTAIDSTSYNVPVSGMTHTGTVIASIPAGVAISVSGSFPNAPSANGDNLVNFDNTPVPVTINAALGQLDPTTSVPINFVVHFDEAVTGFAADDVTIGGTAGGAKTVTVGGTSQDYTVEVRGLTTAGTVIASIAAGRAQNSLGNVNSASTSTDNTVWFDDGEAPVSTAIKAASQKDPTNEVSIKFTVSFSKIVTGFGDDPADVSVDGTAFGAGSVKNVSFTTNPNDWTVTVSGMTGPGTVILSVPPGVAEDAAHNLNAASSPAQVVFDNVRPTVTLALAAGQTDPTANLTVNFSATFSKPVSDFATGDVTLGGTAGATTVAVSNPSGDLVTYNIAVTGMTIPGTIFVTVPDSKATDAAGNNNTASNTVGVTFDTPPSVTVNQAPGQSDPTNALSINFKVVFSELVTPLLPGGVTLSGSAGPTTAVITAAGDGTTYNVAVSGMTTSGTIVVTIPAGAVKDVAGNDNLASTSTDNIVSIDIVRPTVTVNQVVGQGDPTNTPPINFTVVFSEPVADFATGDVTLSGTAGATTATVTGSGTTYNVAVSGMTQFGTVIAAVAEGVAHDAVGNLSLASTSTDNLVSFDVGGPNVTVEQASGQADPTNTSPINFAVVFSEPVTDFATGDVTLSGTAGATTATVTGSGITYNVAVSGMTQSGTVIATVAAGAAHDAVGNSSSVSTSVDNQVTYDNTALTATINQASAQLDPTNSGPVSFTVVFSKSVSDFAVGDVTVTGAAGGTKTITVTGSGTTYNVAVDGMSSTGTVTASLAAGVVHDSAGNSSAASTSTDNTVTYDITRPTVTITKPTSDPSCTWNCDKLKLSGTASDGVALGTVTWSSSGGTGLCTGTTNWSAIGIGIIGGGDTFTVTATDAAGNTASDSITVTVVQALPASGDWARLAMVSLPIIPYDLDPKLQVGFHSDYWVMFNPDANDYARYPAAQTWFRVPASTPGRGFWAGFTGVPTVSPAGIVPPQDQPATIHLLPGWNLVGQPFIKPVVWDVNRITVKSSSQTKSLADANTLGWVKNYAWGWSSDPDPNNTAGGAYYLVCDPGIIAGATGEMAAWRAYWLRAGVECDVILPAP